MAPDCLLQLEIAVSRCLGKAFPENTLLPGLGPEAVELTSALEPHEDSGVLVLLAFQYVVKIPVIHLGSSA